MEETAADERTLFFQKKKKGKFAVVEPPFLEAPVADTHAHLDMLEDAPLALARAAHFGVNFICAMANPCENPQINYNQLENWLEQARKIAMSLSRHSPLSPHEVGSSQRLTGQSQMVPDDPQVEPLTPKTPKIRIAIGCHPHNAKDFDTNAQQLLRDLLKDPRTCAIGEVGLDYHYDLSPREVQKEVFRHHIRLSHETHLPLILHLREAHEDAYQIMQEEGFPDAGVLLHCFNRDEETAKPWLEAGCQIAVGGAVTFKKSEETREAVKGIPNALLMTETDAPFMAPEPMRSSKCEPAHTVFTAAKIAEVKNCEAGESRRELLQQLYENALNLLDRPPTPWQAGQR